MDRPRSANYSGQYNPNWDNSKSFKSRSVNSERRIGGSASPSSRFGNSQREREFAPQKSRPGSGQSLPARMESVRQQSRSQSPARREGKAGLDCSDIDERLRVLQDFLRAAKKS